LEDCCLFPFIFNFNWFQFHFGSIGRVLKDEKLCDEIVSIPLWFDWKQEGAVLSLLPTVFQFHFGSIGSKIQ